MAENVPTIAYWMGEPLSGLPHEKLCEIISEQAREIGQLRRENCDRSVAHIRDLADAQRRYMRDTRSPLVRLLDDVFSPSERVPRS